MKWNTFILNILFPSPFPEELFKLVPEAPIIPNKKIFALYDYRNPLGKKLVRTLKKYHSPILAQNIAHQMYEYLLEYIAEQQSYSFFMNPLIVPVPITNASKRSRGFNQSTYIAKYLGKYMNGISSSSLVYKNKETKKQALVSSRKNRYANVSGSFSVYENKKKLVYHQDIIIVDDLITTGATIDALSVCLKKAGARNIIAITVAH